MAVLKKYFDLKKSICKNIWKKRALGSVKSFFVSKSLSTKNSKGFFLYKNK